MNPFFQILIGLFLVVIGFFLLRWNKKNLEKDSVGLYIDAKVFPYISIIFGLYFIVEAIDQLLKRF